MKIEFFVQGIPATAGSKKAFPIRTGRFKPNSKTGAPQEVIRVVVTDSSGQKGKSWRESVRSACSEVFQGAPMTGPLNVSMCFFMPYRKGDYGTGRNAGQLKENAPKYVVTKPDGLKLARGTEDALTGVLWVDDSQVVGLIVKKLYSERPGALIKVERPLDASDIQFNDDF
jgi:Holliday junction resolvase RusA-like endonuclease